MEFNNTQITDMRNFLNENSPVRNALVIGNKGLGKSYVIKKLISEYNYITISFSKDFYLPFEYIKKGLSLSSDVKREEIIRALSDTYVSNHYIVYENFEYCDKDSMELIKQVIQFHDNYIIPAISIFELNSKTVPDYINWMNPYCIKFKNFSTEEIDLYIRSIIYANNNEELEYACNQLISIAEGNLLSLHLAKNILLQKGILIRSASTGLFKYIGEEFPGNLLFLYMDLFKILDIHMDDYIKIFFHISLFHHIFYYIQSKFTV